MKLKVLAAAVASVVSIGAHADGIFSDPSIGLYFKQPLGAVTKQSGLASYGMQLNYQAPVINSQDMFSRQQRSLLDIRFQEAKIDKIKLNGLTVAYRDNDTNALTSNFVGDSETETAMWIGGALVFGVVACNQEWFGLCEDDDPSYTVPG